MSFTAFFFSQETHLCKQSFVHTSTQAHTYSKYPIISLLYFFSVLFRIVECGIRKKDVFVYSRKLNVNMGLSMKAIKIETLDILHRAEQMQSTLMQPAPSALQP